MAKPKTPAALQPHLAYEVDWLAYAAVKFADVVDGKQAVVFQTAIFTHARNLLEFTRPKEGSGGAWWITGPAGNAPPDDARYREMVGFINAKVSHLGGNRTKSPKYPSERTDSRRYIDIARFCFERLASCASEAAPGYRDIVTNIARLGLAHLDGRVALDELDRLTETQ